MAKRSKKHLLRSPGILVVAFTVLLAMSGLVWTHWTDTLEVRGQVDTGYIDIYWTEDGTSDDGVSDPWDNEPRPAPDFVWWPSGPFSGDQTLLDDGSVLGLAKDVARCTVELVPDGAGDPDDRMIIRIENAYPSYWCVVYFDLHNAGTVPLKMQELFFAASSHPIVFNGPLPPPAFQFEVPGAVDPHLEFGFGTGGPTDPSSRAEFPGFFGCGFQIDPGDDYLAEGYFHLDQEAEQNSEYWFELSMDWVNWNEYDEAACLSSYPFP